MYKRIDFTQLGGNPIDQDSFAFMQKSYIDAFGAIANLIGNYVIVTGMAVVGGNISDGWLVYNGVLMPFVGGALGDGSISVVEVDNGDVEYQNNDMHKVEYTKHAVLGVPATFNYTDLVRLTTMQNMWLKSDVKEVDCSGAYIAANFDETGLGINERKGWAICNGNNGTKNRGGRVSVGYSTVVIDPVDNVWDVIYNTIASVGGEKKHTLTNGELPSENITIHQGDSYTGTGGGGTVGRGADHANDIVIHFGNDEAHENRQPFIVTLFIQKL
jgi:hypothetical protein